MTKAWCIWCEMGSEPKHGYYWIHPECFEQLDSVRSKIGMVEKYLKGEMPRIKSNGDRQGYESVEKFLTEMADFDRRSRNVLKLFKAYKENTPVAQIEFEQPPSEPKEKLTHRLQEAYAKADVRSFIKCCVEVNNLETRLADADKILDGNLNQLSERLHKLIQRIFQVNPEIDPDNKLVEEAKSILEELIKLDLNLREGHGKTDVSCRHGSRWKWWPGRDGKGAWMQVVWASDCDCSDPPRPDKKGAGS